MVSIMCPLISLPAPGATMGLLYTLTTWLFTWTQTMVTTTFITGFSMQQKLPRQQMLISMPTMITPSGDSVSDHNDRGSQNASVLVSTLPLVSVKNGLHHNWTIRLLILTAIMASTTLMIARYPSKVQQELCLQQNTTPPMSLLLPYWMLLCTKICSLLSNMNTTCNGHRNTSTPAELSSLPQCIIRCQLCTTAPMESPEVLCCNRCLTVSRELSLMELCNIIYIQW